LKKLSFFCYAQCIRHNLSGIR